VATPVAHPLTRRALSSALWATAAVALATSIGGAVRLLPWLLDPKVTLRLAAPFARGLLALAVEAAIVLGWPIGWALASASIVERGEARALASLGQSPAQSVLRLAPQAAVFACALGIVSFVGGEDASAPGRVVTELIARGRESCLGTEEATTYSVPFAGVTWLCAPGVVPRLVGRGPGGLSSTEFTAVGATASGDLREIDLEAPHLHVPFPSTARSGTAGEIDVAVGRLRLRGLSPFAHASSVPPLARAAALALAAVAAAAAGAFGVLSGVFRGRMGAIVGAASGSFATLGTMRSIERSGGTGLATVAVPFAALAAALLAGAILSRLPRGYWTASK
jgi:hypothetical protein